MPVRLETDRNFILSLWLQGFSPSSIELKTGVKSGTVKTWSHRFGWHQLRDKTKQACETSQSSGIALAVARKTANALSERSDTARSHFADAVESSIVELNKSPVKVKQLGPRAKVLKDLVDSASKVYGWDQTSVNVSFGLNLLEPDAAKPVVTTDVEATVLPDKV